MAPPAQSFAYTSPFAADPGTGAGEGVPATAAWSGSVLTDSVTSGDNFLASFAGQAYEYLTTPLPGWQYGLAS